MKKICNIVIMLIAIAIIIVIIAIVIRYGNNYLNEKDVSSTLNEIEQKIEQQTVNNGTEEQIDAEYKGYKIEGIIEIPKINIKYPILTQTTESTMKISITKFFGPNINEIGNYTVAGHNNKDGTMFGKTKYLNIGDIIKLTDLHNKTIEYKIFKIYSIDPDDLSCTESTEEGTKEVTLITCTNGHKNRLITKAKENL